MIEPLFMIYPELGLSTVDMNTTIELVRQVVSGQKETFLMSWDRLMEFAFWYGAACMAIGAIIWEITRRAGEYLAARVREEKKNMEANHEE